MNKTLTQEQRISIFLSFPPHGQSCLATTSNRRVA